MVFKGWKTFIYGGLVAVLPSALAFAGSIDWNGSGLPPWVVSLIGIGIIGLRTVTTTPPGKSS